MIAYQIAKLFKTLVLSKVRYFKYHFSSKQLTISSSVYITNSFKFQLNKIWLNFYVFAYKSKTI